jgi:hypothetical protein
MRHFRREGTSAICDHPNPSAPSWRGSPSWVGAWRDRPNPSALPKRVPRSGSARGPVRQQPLHGVRIRRAARSAALRCWRKIPTCTWSDLERVRLPGPKDLHCTFLECNASFTVIRSFRTALDTHYNSYRSTLSLVPIQLSALSKFTRTFWCIFQLLLNIADRAGLLAIGIRKRRHVDCAWWCNRPVQSSCRGSFTLVFRESPSAGRIRMKVNILKILRALCAGGL